MHEPLCSISGIGISSLVFQGGCLIGLAAGKTAQGPFTKANSRGLPRWSFRLLVSPGGCGVERLSGVERRSGDERRCLQRNVEEGPRSNFT